MDEATGSMVLRSGEKKHPNTNITIRMEDFTLNRIKALREKQKAGCRPDDMRAIVTGGGVVLTFSAAMYEAFRHALQYSGYQVTRQDVDESGTATIREIIVVTNTRKKKLYTMNLYPSKSRALVNGNIRNLHEQFLKKDLPYLVSVIDQALRQMNIDTKALNKQIVEAISQCLKDIRPSQSDNSQGSSPSNEIPTENPASTSELGITGNALSLPSENSTKLGNPRIHHLASIPNSEALEDSNIDRIIQPEICNKQTENHLVEVLNKSQEDLMGDDDSTLEHEITHDSSFEDAHEEVAEVIEEPADIVKKKEETIIKNLDHGVQVEIQVSHKQKTKTEEDKMQPAIKVHTDKTSDASGINMVSNVNNIKSKEVIEVPKEPSSSPGISGNATQDTKKKTRAPDKRKIRWRRKQGISHVTKVIRSTCNDCETSSLKMEEISTKVESMSKQIDELTNKSESTLALLGKLTKQVEICESLKTEVENT